MQESSEVQHAHLVEDAQGRCRALQDAPAVSEAAALRGAVSAKDGTGWQDTGAGGLGLRLVCEHGFTTGVQESCGRWRASLWRAVGVRDDEMLQLVDCVSAVSAE